LAEEEPKVKKITKKKNKKGVSHARETHIEKESRKRKKRHSERENIHRQRGRINSSERLEGELVSWRLIERGVMN
jgi:hypothetical protein